MPTTAATAKQRIITALQARAGLAGVTVSYGAPSSSDEIDPEMIFLGDVRFSQAWAALGARRRDEDYTIDLTVHVYQDGDEEQVVEERLWALFGEIEQALRDDPTLGGLLAMDAEIDGGEQTTRPSDPGGWVSRLSLRVRCRSRY